MITKQETVVN